MYPILHKVHITTFTKLHYVGFELNLLSLKSMSDIYAPAANNIRLAKERKAGDIKANRLHIKATFQVGDLDVLLNHTRGVWDSRYGIGYRISHFRFERQAELEDRKGKKERLT